MKIQYPPFIPLEMASLENPSRNLENPKFDDEWEKGRKIFLLVSFDEFNYSLNWSLILTLDSSEDEATEVVCETKSKIIDQSPGAVKRLFRKQFPKDETEPLPIKNSLIPSRTYNKMKTQKSR